MFGSSTTMKRSSPPTWTDGPPTRCLYWDRSGSQLFNVSRDPNLSLFTIRLRDPAVSTMQAPAISTERLLYVLLVTLVAVGVARRTWNLRGRRAFARSRGCLPPRSRAPVKDPIFGFDFIYDAIFNKAGDRYLESTLKSFRELGTTYTMSRWAMSVFYTCDSLNMKQILAGSFEDFGLPHTRVTALSSFVGDGIFTLDNEPWYHARMSLKPMVARSDKETIRGILEGNFQSVLRLLPDDGASVNLQDIFFRLVMDFATEYLTGNSAHMLDNEDTQGARAQQFVSDYMTCSTEVITCLGLGPLQHLRFNSDAKRAKNAVFSFLDAFIDDSLRKRAIKGASVRDDFLTQLTALTTDRMVLRNQLLHILIATRDTVASTLSNLFFVLARNPQVYDKLRANVLAVAGTEAPTTDQLKQMKFARWCVNESLRLHPVIPIGGRQARRDTVLPRGGGADGQAPLLVPEGTIVMSNVYAMHRDEQVFGANVEAFNPERWDNLHPGWGYLPFSGGPRICMGQHIALTVVQYILVRMAQTVSSIDGLGEKDWVEQYALATTCRGGVHVSLHKA
ncbi:hypothetical protein JDV02_008724 [Purpureocillium takamizusanense]|uniref:Cytochrome P450 alkane hydroxylase n=1 Tax=Purpureocillium takamizusanense TaxID=2060973 RepID=A0A9Q8VER0_9HYPO|nr:uncharacterized protein JDV02_008724 [Purpureocillium takamizusanense]UNI22878.1 hypothetical protein JDV02_008724 [Purpureocillium takamizusanense]